jgi:hypothetical protein
MKELKICWVSAGISSFMAGYLAGNVDEWIYIDIQDQHPDSIRFIKDCEKAIGKEIQILKSSEYNCVEDCVRAFGGFRNPHNGFAPCTNYLKKRVRKEWEEQHKDYELTYVWGFDLKEKNQSRANHRGQSFHSRAKLEREIGYSILKDNDEKPIFLDELEPNRGNMNTEIFPDCSIMCYIAENEKRSE